MQSINNSKNNVKNNYELDMNPLCDLVDAAPVEKLEVAVWRCPSEMW